MKSSVRLGLVDRLCVIAGVGLAVATLLGFLGRFFWVFDLFSHFRVQLFQLGLVLIGISIWKKNNRQLVCWILLACLNYAVVLPLYFGKPPVATEQPARAMLMNLNADNGNTEQVLNAIKTSDPDLLLLEEVTPSWAAELSVLDYPYCVSKPQGGCFGVMLLSKHPLSHTNVLYLTGRDASPRRPRTAGTAVPTIIADIHLPQGEISVIGTHPLPPVGAKYSKHRNAQLSDLSPLVREQKKPVLLIGDLNTSPWSSHFVRLLKESGLKNSMNGFGFQPSWPSENRFLRIPLDHMLHSPDILIHRRVVGGDVGSDHLPLIVDFSIQQEKL